MPFDFMHSLNRPKCPSCDTPIVWGVTTRKQGDKEICNVCRAVLGKG
ncbi:hypothetical protein GF361_04970 [Candidatus Woesearchaeota archaeon]|nr:hypothetical protein [Candidatus Woesearchaeota archaeon]